MEIQQVRSVHFIGLGGIGVSAMARLFLHRGCAVSGSDLRRSEITDELEGLGATVSIGHAAQNIPAAAQLVVYSPAVSDDNPERLEALRRGTMQKSYPEMLGELMADTYGIAVSGTNGKTTTTALLGHILVEAGLDPRVIVGSKVGNFNGLNLRLGGFDRLTTGGFDKFRPRSFDPEDIRPSSVDGLRTEGARLEEFTTGGDASAAPKANYFVVEGCEYRRHFLNLRPKMIVVTNIEVDHLDYFRDFDDIKDAFREYVALLPADGMFVYNIDDPTCREIVSTCRARTIAYGRYNVSIHCSGAGTWLVGREVGEEGQVLRVAFGSSPANFVEVPLSLPGEIYAANALAAIAAAHALGISAEQIARAVASFRGTWRRFERIGEVAGKPIISDYAHHPTAVRETLKAARECFPGRRILAVFQPHQRNRTKNLLDDFSASFDAADNIIIAEIYDVAGREEGLEISSRDLVSRLQDAGQRARYGANLDETLALIKDQLHSVDVVLIMGAGDIYTIGQKLFRGK